MNDILLFLLIPALVFLFYLFGKVIELTSECWHKWDKWIVWQTEEAYCQGRKCSKCGQQQIMQTRKVRNEQSNV